jgi:hypothetical protein
MTIDNGLVNLAAIVGTIILLIGTIPRAAPDHEGPAARTERSGPDLRASSHTSQQVLVKRRSGSIARRGLLLPACRRRLGLDRVGAPAEHVQNVCPPSFALASRSSRRAGKRLDERRAAERRTGTGPRMAFRSSRSGARTGARRRGNVALLTDTSLPFTGASIGRLFDRRRNACSTLRDPRPVRRLRPRDAGVVYQELLGFACGVSRALAPAPRMGLGAYRGALERANG